MDFKADNLSPHRHRAVALGVFAVALIVRLLFIFESHSLPEIRTPTPGLDTCLHWECGILIREGTPDPCLELMLPSAPLHPYFVAVSQTILGEHLLTHRIFRAILGSLSVMFVYLLTWRISRHRLTSLLSALFVLTLPSWIYFDTMVIKASVEIFFLSVSLWLLLMKADGWSLRTFVGVGILLGVLLSLLRFSQGATALYFVVMTLFVLLRRNYATLPAKLCLVLPMIILFAGSQLAFKHREALFGIPANHFLPVGGVHMRVGFQPGAIGTYHVLRRFPALPLGHTFFSRMAAEAKAGQPLTPAEADQTYIDEAKHFIRKNPGETVNILFRKAAIFFNNFEAQGNHFLPQLKKDSRVLRIPTIGYGGLVILSFWGAVSLWRQKRYSLLVLLIGLGGAVFIVNMLSFVTWRYRLHTTLPMAILAGPGFVYFYERVRAIFSRTLRFKQRVIATLCIVVPTCILAHAAFQPVLTNARKMMRQTHAKNKALSIKAEAYLKELDDLATLSYLTPQQRIKRSTLNHVLGRYTRSFQELEQLVVDDPSIVAASRQYLLYLMWYGNYDAAAGFLKTVAQKDPESFNALIQSYESDSNFWDGADTNLRLIMQAIIRDILIPKLEDEGIQLRRQRA